MNLKCLFKHKWLVHRVEETAIQHFMLWGDWLGICGGLLFSGGGGAAIFASILAVDGSPFWSTPLLVSAICFSLLGLLLFALFRAEWRDKSCLRCGKHVFNATHRKKQKADRAVREEASRSQIIEDYRRLRKLAEKSV